MIRRLLLLAALLCAPTLVHAQQATTVTACGALAYDAGYLRPLTQDVTGTLCTAGGPGGTTSTVSQGSTTSTQSGTLVQGAVTTAAPTYTTGKTNPLSLATNGSLRTQATGDVANAAADSGNPLKVGWVYTVTAPPAYSTGQRTNAQATQHGSLRVYPVGTAAAYADGVAATVTRLGRDDTDEGTAHNLAVTPYLYNGSTVDGQRSVANATNSTGTGIAAVGLVGQVDDTSPTAITENQFGNVRMGTNRALLSQPISPYPYSAVGAATATPLTAHSGNVAAGTAAATLTGTATTTVYITGFECTASGSTAALVTNLTVTGTLGGTMTYTFVFPAGVAAQATPLIVEYPVPIPASAVNTAIVVSNPTGGSGNTNSSCNAHGFYM